MEFDSLMIELSRNYPSIREHKFYDNFEMLLRGAFIEGQAKILLEISKTK